MYYVILENIRGNFGDNRAPLVFKLKTVFKNMS